MNLYPRLAKAIKSFLRPNFITLFLSLLASLLLLLSSYLSFRNLERTLELNLKLQAKVLEITLQSLLKTFDFEAIKKNRAFFSELLLNERWEGVAYLSLYDENKTIVLHSNPELIGSKVEKSLLLQDNQTTGYLTLKTGEKVFIYENFLTSPKGKTILRIALHTGPVEENLHYARRHFLLDLTLSLILLLGGILGFFMLSRVEKHLRRMDELELWQFVTKILLHEIKNPLASIKGFSQYLLKQSLDEKKERPLSIILKEALRIEKLLQELFNYSFERPPSWQELDLRAILEEVIASLQILYEKVKIEREYLGSNFLVKSDPEKLKSILINLLENALFASESAGKEKVLVNLKEEALYYLIEIKDEGEGIEEALLPRIFEPFFTTKARGTGLGLAIVKKFSEELKIELKIGSRKGKGTMVWLKIPKSPS